MADSFLESSNVQDVAESHVERVVGLEKDEAEKILKVYKKVRSDLRDRLDLIPGGTFTAQKMQSTLVQVELAIQAIQNKLKQEMSSSADLMSEQALNDLISEIKKFEKKFTGASIPINLDGAVIASNVNNLLMSRMESSLETYNVFLRSRISQGLSEAVIAQDNYTEIVRKINLTLMGEEWKAQQIVRTELHNVYSMAKIEGMRDLKDGSIPDLKKALYHPMDKRTGADSKKADSLNLIVDVDDYFEYTWKGEKRRFFQPPDRPNDRSILIPYRESWA